MSRTGASPLCGGLLTTSVYREQTQFSKPCNTRQTTHSKEFARIQMPENNWLCLGLLSPEIGFRNGIRQVAQTIPVVCAMGCGFQKWRALYTIRIHDTAKDIKFVCVIMILLLILRNPPRSPVAPGVLKE